MKYVHLHNHSEASISDGLFGVRKWVKAIKERGFKGHALTDHGVMTNLLPFYTEMKAENLIPIMGAEFYYVDNPTAKDKDNRKASHLILIAKNFEGWQNLCRLSKLSFTEGYYYRNRIGLEWITKHREGLICMTACQGGVLSNEVWREAKGEPCMGLEARFRQFHAIFGDDLYVEFQGHNTVNSLSDGTKFNSQQLVNEQFFERLAKLHGFKQIVTNDCHYILPEHAVLQQTVKDMAYGRADTGESATVTKDHFTDSLWLKSGKEVYEAFREHHDYLPKQFVADGMVNTMEILEKCKDFAFPNRRYLPTFRATINSREFFRKYTIKLLKKFLNGPDLHGTKREYVDRYKEELRVISKYKLEDYFLIVWDLIRFAEKQDIYHGLGRGSAAGCLISYLLGIVKIDPIEHKLYFERFLNENRCESGELPDIDLDFESERRHEVKQYIFDTYGADRVCEIGTYGRMKLKTSLLDFGKALNVAAHRDLQDITKNLDLEKEDVNDLEAAIASDPRLKKLVDDNPAYGFAVKEIIGQIKTQSVHPAGVVICCDPLEDLIPLKSQKKTGEEEGSTTRSVTTQPEDKHVIAQGFMKMDVLGLKEYDVIRYVIQNAPTGLTRKNYVEEIMRRERTKPDKEVWKMFQLGKTEGVFQFSSDGMKGLLQSMEPNCINDLIAANALFRPGCLENGWHTLYCDRKHGRELVEYVHVDVEKALSDSYGVIVFQEQFMEVIHRLGDISLVDTDTLRSALGKKDEVKLKKFTNLFIDGAEKKIGRDAAEELWDQLMKAAGYTFNRSHSAAYSVLAYISQYFKVHHTAHFWSGQIEWDVKKKKLDEMLQNRRAASEMGVEFMLPSINLSKQQFYVIKGETNEFGMETRDSVVWSLRSMKGIGPKAAIEIEAKQPFASFEDFYKRVSKTAVRFNNMESLIYGGAFDSFGDRRDLLRQLYAMSNARSKGKTKSLVVPTEDKLLFGFYDSLGFFERKIKKVRAFNPNCITEQDLRDYGEGDTVRVGGMVTKIRVHKTKNGDSMGFVTLMDLDEIIEITVFPKIWESERRNFSEGAIVEVLGQKNIFNGKQNQILAENFIPVG